MSVEHYTLLLADAITMQDKIEVHAPFDNSLIATVDNANAEAVALALQSAYATYCDRKAWLSIEKRIAILEKLSNLMTEQQQFLAIEAAREGGKPLQDSLAEVARAIDGVKICIETLRTESGKVIPMRYNAASAKRIAFTQREPIGVVVAVSAFNHPVNLIIHQIAAAVAVGCPVIVKPATDTPLSCLRIVKLLYAAGLPSAWCQALVIDDNQVAEKLVTDSRIGFFSFIGSAKVGWYLRSKLAAGVRCSLEHGGAAPVIMSADADLQHALPLLTKGGFYHAGQVCVSVQRIFAEKKIVMAVANGLAEQAAQLTIGDPTLPDTAVGPLIRTNEVERVAAWVDEAVAAGAKLISGGKIISPSCYACTVLLDPKDTAKVSAMEIFGPVVCVYSVDNIDEALQRANQLQVAFQAAVFTQDIDQAMYIYSNLDASAVMLNDHSAFRVDGMPFAGLKHSGLGVGGIPHTMHDMQIEKMLVIHSNSL